ncbi:MAG: UDP-N-acetylmuramoyl-tripeptide--D-alanyl-D-alanine ligase [Candidatus Omnitrophota bacterium]|nr:UDP-N-acetylmuramoyl-tripeptide--D-alanyl-D-alanine ligase [Candidatus Omnitrophota bacterium]
MFNFSELVLATKASRFYKAGSDKFGGISIDSRTIKRNEVFIAIKGDNFDGHDYIESAIKSGSSCIILSKSCVKKIPSRISRIYVQDTVLSLGDVARFWRNKFTIPVIGVTGSNGKTTTKDMLAWVLGSKFKVLKNEGTKNNHIGLPMTLLKLNNSYEIAVVELGTNHFGEISYLSGIARPNIAVITNIGPSHLEFFKDLNGVFDEKTSLLKYLNRPALSILNADDPYLKKLLIKKNISGISVGIRNQADFNALRIRMLKGKVLFAVNYRLEFTLGAIGEHNVYNALFTVAAARIFGISYEDCARRMRSFVFPPARLQLTEFQGIKFIDDTYNSNPLSFKIALDTLASCGNKGKKILIMGDMLELGKENELFHFNAVSQALRVCDVLITVGRHSRLAAKNASLNKSRINDIINCFTAQEAAKVLFERILPKQNDIVLVKGSRAMGLESIFKK